MDYSPYYFNYTEKPKNELPQPEMNKKKNRWAIVLIAIIILSLILSLYLIGRLKNEDLFAVMVNALTKKEMLTYYLVCLEPFEYKEEAIIKSTYARVSGGAGYLYVQNNAYFVAMATYMTEKVANEVVEKNDGLRVIEIKINKVEVLQKLNDDALMRECFELMEGVIATLDGTLIDYEKKEINLSDTLRILEKESTKLLNFKKEVIDKKCDYKDDLLDKINPALGGLEAITSATSHNNLASEIRYVTCASAVAICKV